MYFCVLCVIGFGINVWLYFDDIKNRGGVLHKVDTGEEKDDDALKPGDFMTSPTTSQKKKAMDEVEYLKE